MRTHVLAVAGIAFLALLAYGYNVNSHAQTKAAVKTDAFWTTDWDKGIAAAKAQKKPVIIDFYTDWCGWCKKLDKDTYAAPEIQKRLKEGWVGIKINPEDKTKTGTLAGKTVGYADIAKAFEVQGFPTIVFLDKDGARVELQQTINYVPKEPFGPLLDYVKGEMYKKNVLLEKYIQDNVKKK
jgi:thioredoxin-related protein